MWWFPCILRHCCWKRTKTKQGKVREEELMISQFPSALAAIWPFGCLVKTAAVIGTVAALCIKAHHSHSLKTCYSVTECFYISPQAACTLSNWQNIREASLNKRPTLHISNTDAGKLTEMQNEYTHSCTCMLRSQIKGVHSSCIKLSPDLPGSLVVALSCFEPERQQVEIN